MEKGQEEINPERVLKFRLSSGRGRIQSYRYLIEKGKKTKILLLYVRFNTSF
jgi:hypothetical protein